MYEYLLPNGVPVDVERLADAMLFDGEYPRVYLDTETGALIEISSAKSLECWVKEIGATKRYLSVERFTDAERGSMARDFIDSILEVMAPSEASRARPILVTGGWRAMEEFLEEHGDGWIDAWEQYVDDEAGKYLHHWLIENPYVSIKAEFEGCDNCAVCDLIRKGEGGDHEKLMDAFKTEEVMQNVERQVKHRADGSRVMTFKVTLNDSTPKVWRRIVVPAAYTFFDLHCAIQDAMGWTDSHLHAFRIDTRSQTKSKRNGARGETLYIEFPNAEAEREPGETFDERKECVANWFGSRMQQCVYEYDFGDGWDHTVLFEGEASRENGSTYPQCTGGKNACPPEDCGGVGGYDDLQRILKNPTHGEYADMREWLMLEEGEEFDPKEFDPVGVEFCDPAERLKEYNEGFS